MELGLGKLGWPPPVFWNSTIIELTAGAKGLSDMHGQGEDKVEPLSRKEFKALKEKLDAN